jgi:3-isopropylmalate/(R)-2-methylmalate dehydratase small subunit
MNRFTYLSSMVVPLPVNDIDTDQIIPARYLKATDKNGMGEALFADWRYHSDGSPKPDFILNKRESAGCQILLAGGNFGCGSSREHAAWALAGFGFRAVISTSFADIFRSNALKNGLLPVCVDEIEFTGILDLVTRCPQSELAVDLEGQKVCLPGGKTIPFPIDPFSKTCLLKGIDQLGYLLSFSDQITAYERRRWHDEN